MNPLTNLFIDICSVVMKEIFDRLKVAGLYGHM